MIKNEVIVFLFRMALLHRFYFVSLAMLPLFNAPYPLENNLRQKLLSLLLLSLSVFFILYFFRPFGLEAASFQTILGYAAITALLTFLQVFILKPFLGKHIRQEAWKVKYEILWILWNITLIALANTCYAVVRGQADWNGALLLQFQLITLGVSLLPVSLSVLLKHNLLLRHYLHHSQALNNALPTAPKQAPANGALHIELVSESPREVLTLALSDLYYLQAADNYVEVYCLRAGQLQKVVLRNRLKNLEEQLTAYPALFRCHRSYLVNLAQVQAVRGNAQGYQLFLGTQLPLLPVARALGKALQERLHHLQP